MDQARRSICVQALSAKGAEEDQVTDIKREGNAAGGRRLSMTFSAAEPHRISTTTTTRRRRVDLSACLAIAVAMTLGSMLLSAGKASAQSGEADYRHYCASCHGLDGKGKELWNGTQVPDLTRLSQKSHGKFPFEDIYKVVDGRSQSPWHQKRPDMPYWGDVFQQEKLPASKEKVEARITAIVEYVRSLQEK